MVPVSDRFSYFIDHYVLLLAERFGIPLHAEAPAGLNSSGDVKDIDASDLIKWERVAECLQEALSHPKTAEEREALLHVDVKMFDAKVCFGRVQYLMWQTGGLATVPQKELAEGATSTAFSVFNITRDSLHDKVHSIYASVRDRLPSTLVPQRGRGASSVLTTTRGDLQGRDESINYDSGDSGSEESLHVVDIVLPTEAEAERNRAVAEARDDLLSKVQKMQSDFFEKHRRWVDVPLDFDTVPTTQDSFPLSHEVSLGCDAAATSKSAAQEAERGVTPAAPVSSSADQVGAVALETCADRDDDALLTILEALRGGRRAGRPPRPSQMREEDYERQYIQGSSLPCAPAGLPTTLRGGVPCGPGAVVSAEPLRTAESGKHVDEFPLNGSTDATDGNATRGAGLRELSAPQLRANRWHVVEYDREESTGDDSDRDEEDAA